MDIDLLSKMVKELILDHDRVALPGLGVFIAEMVPASFTDKGYTITPPYRRLSFRPGQEDDGLLVSMYASVNEVSTDVALAALTDFVCGMKEVLEKKKAVVFPGLGRLRATRENNFFFVSDEDLDIYPEGFGLEPVSLKTHEETREELSTALGSLKNIIGREEAEASEEVQETDMDVQDGQEDKLPVTDAEAVPEDETDGDDIEIQMQEMEEMPVLVSVEPETGQGPEDVSPDEGKVPDKKKIMLAVLSVLGLAVLLLVLYIAVARLFPGVMDGLLYNEEDQEILHNISQFKN